LHSRAEERRIEVSAESLARGGCFESLRLAVEQADQSGRSLARYLRTGCIRPLGEGAGLRPTRSAADSMGTA
jgi:hypothetical protein